MAEADLLKPAKVAAVYPTNAEKIRGLLSKRYCGPEWAIFFEVASATGAGPQRYADAIAMNLWPSRGLAIHGMEIKISRGDWQTELKKPAKAEAMARNCDYWWIVAAKGVVRDGELPPTWGLMEVDGRGLVVKVAAPALDKPELTRTFMASLIRRAGEYDSREKWRLKQEMTEEIQKSAERRISDQVASRTRAADALSRRVAEFQEASGIDIDHWSGGKAIGECAKLVQDLGIMSTYGGIKQLAENARQFADQVDKIMPQLASINEESLDA